MNATELLGRSNYNNTEFLSVYKEERTFPNSYYILTITLIPKPKNDITRKLQTNIPCKCKHKNP